MPNDRLIIQETVLDGNQNGPVNVNVGPIEDDVVRVTIDDSVLSGEGSQIVIEVSNDLAIAGVDEFTDIVEEVRAAEIRIDTAIIEANEVLDDIDSHIATITNARDAAVSAATQADASATAAATSATSAADSATTAATQANRAQTIADSIEIAGNTQVTRVTSEGDTQVARVNNEGTAQVALATAQADSAAASATNAAASASNAATSELNATASASAAATSATNAATSEVNAAASATQAQQAFSNFTDRYLGAFAVAPTTDNQGDPLQVGSTYWDTVQTTLFYWNGNVWESPDAAASASAAAG